MKFLSADWNAAEVVGDATVADMLPDRISIWKDMESEYDAELLCRELSILRDSGAISFSPEFWEFESVWRKEERNHYVGFRLLCSRLFGMQEEQIDALMSRRSANFSSFNLCDEFHVLTIIAFDEMVTAIAYQKDESFYKKVNLREWIANLKRDESHHSHNATLVLILHYGNRLGECEKILDEMLSRQHGAYFGTFILSDVENPNFTNEEFHDIIRDPIDGSYLIASARIGPANELGDALFATELIQEGNIVAIIGGDILSGVRAVGIDSAYCPNVFKISRDVFLISDKPYPKNYFLNHSCEPNCGISGVNVVFAIRDILSGEMLTYDYAMSGEGLSGACKCGSSRCRRIICGEDFDQINESYLSHYLLSHEYASK